MEVVRRSSEHGLEGIRAASKNGRRGMSLELDRFLQHLRASLHLDAADAEPVLREINAHLEDRVADLQAQGFDRASAERLAIERFGDVRQVAREMCEAHQRPTWREALLAACPHGLVVLFFALGLSRNFPLLALAFAAITVVTFLFWRRGRPQWIYPWAGYSLFPLLVVLRLAVREVPNGFDSWLDAETSLQTGAETVALAVLFPLSWWAVVRVILEAARRDWLLASLMMLPMAVLSGWLLLLAPYGGYLWASPEDVAQFDPLMARMMLAVAVVVAVFFRFGARLLRFALLCGVALVSLAIINPIAEPGTGPAGLALRAVVLLGLLASPALLLLLLDGGPGSLWPPRGQSSGRAPA